MPRRSHTAALSIGAPGERRGAAVDLGEWGAWKVALPGLANDQNIFFVNGTSPDSGGQKSADLNTPFSAFLIVLAFYFLGGLGLSLIHI